MDHGRRRPAALLMAAALLLAGTATTACDDGPPPGDAEAATTSAAPTASTPAKAERTSAPPSSEPSIAGLVIPESDPSTWPPGTLAGVSEEDRAAAIAMWGDRADCSPFSLMIDYDAGLLSPEEYTMYAMYAMAPYVPRRASDPLPEVPARYTLCDDPESFQALGFAMGLFLEDIDPAFRDVLWLQVMGETYKAANRPLTDAEIDEALKEFQKGDLVP